MKARAHLCLASFWLLAPAWGLSVAPAGGQSPNLLVLIADDFRADAIAALGNPAVITPNLDALARRGFVFENAYCMGGNSPAVCTPSRNMLLSGRSYFRFGAAAEPDRPNVPAALRAAGYETWHLGKRGNTAPQIHALFEHTAYLDDEKARLCGEPGRETVDAALEFLSSRAADRPFLMWIEFAVPHDPRVASSELLALYDESKIPLPANFLPLHPFDNGEMEIRDEKLAAWPRTPEEIRRHLRDYYAVITGLDREIGRLLDSLRASGALDRTVVVFTSDQGLALGSHGLMGKQSLYDHSMKAPLIFAGPGIPAGSSAALVYLLDIFPTLCAFAGASAPAGIDGENLLPIIEGNSASVRDSLFLAYRDVQRAIRDERYKLIRYPQIARTQLFDLRNDPAEMDDLSSDPAQASRLAEMAKLLIEWQARFGNALPLTAAAPRDGAWAPPPPESASQRN